MQNYHTASDPNRNIWVSASAGSGKTKVLTDRFIRLLLNGVPPEKILCITFTKIAALEMLTRIKQILANWMLLSDDELVNEIKLLTSQEPISDHVLTARKLFNTFVDSEDTLQIQTVHSFCQKILNAFPFECGLGLNHKIITDPERQIILAKTKSYFLENYAEDPALSNSINFLLENIHEATLDKLIDQTITILELSDLRKEKQEYLRKAKKILDINENTEAEVATLEKNVKQKIQSNYRLFLDTNSEEIKEFATTTETLEKITALFLNKDKSLKKKLLSKKTLTVYPEIHETLRDLQALVFSLYCQEQNLKTFRLTEGFLNLAELFNQHFTEHKRQHNLIDYDDLINLCTELLNNNEMSNWVERKLNAKIEHILVDEAQDINIKQWQVINSCMQEFFSQDSRNTIFVVGDQKQSIYSFQGSSSELFNGMKKFIGDCASVYCTKLEEISFTHSFRSDTSILNFIDKTFAIITQLHPDYFCEENLTHIAKKKFPEASVEIWPLIIQDSLAKTTNAWQVLKEYSDNINEKKQLADLLANKIASLIKDRNFSAGDFMILVRKRDEFVDHMVRALKEKSIPVNGLDRINLKSNIAVQDLLALIKFLLLPDDDYNLACLLKSPIFSISEEDLLTLCQREEKSLWQNLANMANLNSTFKQIYITLKEILSNKPLRSPYKLIYYCLDIKKYRENFISRFGDYINEVLDEFTSLCLEFEQNPNCSLLAFTEWFKNCEIEVKREIISSKNEVKVMTIHGAKGMQSKFVILPDTTSIPKSQDSIIFDRVENVILYKNSHVQNPKYGDIVEGVKLQTLQEYYRLLYVGLTRAEQHLLICGCHSSDTIPVLSWYKIIETGLQHS